MNEPRIDISDSGWKSLCRIGGVAAFIATACSLMTMVVGVTWGWEPTTASEYFSALQENRLVGLLRLDFPSVINVVQYYLIFFGFYAALRRTEGAYAALAAALAFVGVTLWLSAHSGFSMISLSELHAAATTEAQRAQLLAAGTALIASDMWHSTGAFVGGILLQSATVLMSLIMLRSNIFSKATGYVGLLTHGLDLVHIPVGLFAPAAGNLLMAVAGPLYVIWFPLVGLRLLKLGGGRDTPTGKISLGKP